VTPPPVDDDGFDEADVLADVPVLGLDDADALFVALGDDEAGDEPDADDRTPLAGGVQVEFGVGWFSAVRAEPGLPVFLLWLGLGLGLGLGDDGGLDSVLLGLALGLPPGLGLPLGLAEEPALVPALARLLALDDALALSVELLFVTAADECADDDEHVLAEV
jgi:hypothetical protein